MEVREKKGVNRTGVVLILDKFSTIRDGYFCGIFNVMARCCNVEKLRREGSLLSGIQVHGVCQSLHNFREEYQIALPRPNNDIPIEYQEKIKRTKSFVAKKNGVRRREFP